MTLGRVCFDRFVLDPVDRTLRRDGVRVEINSRYLDALILLLREPGKLVVKERFLTDVWRNVPVTDEALTQCIKTLRRQLGDDAQKPRFIETVPKHGYRFVAPACWSATDAPDVTSPISASTTAIFWRRFLTIWGAGTIGAGVAGLVGGVAYGSVGASAPLGTGAGGASVFLVLLWLTIAAALTGGAGVSMGIAAASVLRAGAWRIAGGAIGGLVVGGTAKLLGLDAFNLLLGRSPEGITGAPEGLLLGGAVGLGAWLTHRGASSVSLVRRIAVAGLAGGAGAIAIALLGGRLMGGSLDLLARTFAGSRLRLDPLGTLFGEGGFGPVARIVTSGVEGILFGCCIVGAMCLASRSVGERGSRPD